MGLKNTGMEKPGPWLKRKQKINRKKAWEFATIGAPGSTLRRYPPVPDRRKSYKPIPVGQDRRRMKVSVEELNQRPSLGRSPQERKEMHIRKRDMIKNSGKPALPK